MGRTTISLARWVPLSALHEARSLRRASSEGIDDGDGSDDADPRRAYLDRAMEAAKLLLHRLRDGMPHNAQCGPAPCVEDVCIDSFSAEVEMDDAAQLGDSGVEDGCTKKDEELLYISKGSLRAVCFAGSLENKLVDKELWQSPAFLQRVGVMLYFIFTRGGSPPIDNCNAESNGLKSPPEELSEQSTPKKRLAKAEKNPYEQLFPSGNLPPSLCRLIGDLVRPRDEVEHPFRSLGELIYELKQLSEAPEVHLRPTNGETGQLKLGEVIYGRTSEIHSLIQVAARVSVEESPDTRLVLIKGASGSGKSQLVKSIQEPLSNWGFVHICAKFDRLAQQQPLSIIATAMDTFFQGVAARRDREGDDNADNIVETMERELSVSGIIVLSNLIPSLRSLFPHILRRVVSDPDLLSLAQEETEPRRTSDLGNIVEDDEDETSASNAEASRNRLHYLFRKLVRAISSPENPLLLFLDDLQWADRSSLDLISSLLLDFDHLDLGNDEVTPCFFVAGTYRDSEVHANHILTPNLARFDQSDSVRVTKIDLGPLPKDDANLMVAHCTNLTTRLTPELTDVIMGKTAGNPFHIRSFLQSLVADQIIRYSLVECRFVWDLEAVRAVSIDESVAELLTRRLLQLPDAVQAALKVVACFGTHIDDSTVSLLTPSDEWSGLPDGIAGAVSANILEKSNNGYRFGHDVLEQTSYELMEEEERLRCHYKIGMQLISTTPSSETTKLSPEANLAIGQINRSRAFERDDPFRMQSALLNLLAGRRAIAKTDFVSALSFMEYGIKHLPEGGAWDDHYSLCLALHECAALSCFVLALVDKMQFYLTAVFERATSLEDRLYGYYMLIRSLASVGSLDEAAEKLFIVLEQLDVELPDQAEVTPDLARKELMSTKSIIEGLTPDEILSARRMTDARSIWVVKLLSIFIQFLYLARPKYLPLVASRMIKISASDGYSSDSALGFLGFGHSLIVLGDIENGYKLGRMALMLLQGLDTTESLPRVRYRFYGTFALWKEPLQAIKESLREIAQENLAAGENEEAVLSTFTRCRVSFYVGDKLASVALDCAYATSTMARLRQVNVALATAMHCAVVLQLMGSDRDPLEGFKQTFPIQDEDDLLRFALSKGKAAIVGIIHQKKMLVSFWLGRYKEAGEMAAKYDNSKFMGVADVEHVFYEGLIAFRLFRSGDEAKLEVGKAAVSSFKAWVSHSTWNWENKLFLLEAEMLSCEQDVAGAEAKYQAAIRSAREHKFVHEQGLANELFAEFHAANGDTDRAKSHLSEARACYEKWGATAVVERIDSTAGNS